MYPLRMMDTGMGKSLAAWSKDGWNIEDLVTPADTTVPYSFVRGEYGLRDHWPPWLSGQRRIGDKYTFSVDLDTQGIEDAIPEYPIEVCRFSISLSRYAEAGVHRSSLSHFILKVQSQNHPLLKYSYTSAKTQWSGVQSRLDSLLLPELLKFPQLADAHLQEVRLDRPITNGKGRALVWNGTEPNRDQLPAEWRFLDHLLLEWLG